MSNVNPYASHVTYDVAQANEAERTAFIHKTYLHLGGAIGLFVALETLLFTLVPAATMQSLVAQMVSGYMWLVVLGAFMLVSWVARSWAESGASRGAQYAGLGLYVVAQAVIFLPLLYMAMQINPEIPAMAGLLTMVTFGGLTAMVFVTRVDLHWIGKYLFMAGLRRWD